MPKKAVDVSVISKVVNIIPDSADAWFVKGRLLAHLGKYQDAIECFDKLTRLKPNYADAWLYKYEVFDKLGKLEDAIECLTNYRFFQGLSLYRQGEYEEAIRFYERAIKLSPYNARTWHVKGIALEKLGRNNEARRCFDKARELGFKMT
jgi:tetratricopeptide (TPR) repeat protein